jgi:predicted TPR repeat methyltransferase
MSTTVSNSAQPTAAALLARVRALAGSGRIKAARPLLAAARRRGADPDEADLIEGGLLLHAVRVGDALALFDAAVARNPEHSALREARARARLLADDPLGAACDAAEAVTFAPADPAAKATLGIAMSELGHLDDAMACLAEAVRADPRNHGFRLALAHTLDQAGQLDAAEATLEAGIALAPAAASPLWSAAARRAIALGDFGKALALCRAARGAGVVDPCLLGMQAHALSSLGEHDAAADAYEEALQLAPEDSYVRHLVAASGRRPPEPRAPADYVRVVFDGYANRFDEHIFSLGYRVPGLIRAALLAHADLSAEARLGPVLDLGCGTGLTALALSDLPLGPWHGIDISAAMLRCARRKGLYESLIEAPLPEGLAAPSPPCALALAGDLCCYFGELSALFEATRHRLRV